MAKTTVVDWKSFMDGEVVNKEAKRSVVFDGAPATIAQLALAPIFLHAIHPAFAHAAEAVPAFAGGNAWMNAINGIRNVSDWLSYGCIVFSAWTWMFGNRTKAIEVLTGSAIGVIIINHAMDIENFLKGV